MPRQLPNNHTGKGDNSTSAGKGGIPESRTNCFENSGPAFEDQRAGGKAKIERAVTGKALPSTNAFRSNSPANMQVKSAQLISSQSPRRMNAHKHVNDAQQRYDKRSRSCSRERVLDGTHIRRSLNSIYDILSNEKNQSKDDYSNTKSSMQNLSRSYSPLSHIHLSRSYSPLSWDVKNVQRSPIQSPRSGKAHRDVNDLQERQIKRRSRSASRERVILPDEPHKTRSQSTDNSLRNESNQSKSDYANSIMQSCIRPNSPANRQKNNGQRIPSLSTRRGNVDNDVNDYLHDTRSRSALRERARQQSSKANRAARQQSELQKRQEAARQQLEKRQEAAWQQLEIEKRQEAARQQLEIKKRQEAARQQLEIEKRQEAARQQLEIEKRQEAARQQLEIEKRQEAARQQLEFENRQEAARQQLEIEKRQEAARQQLEFEKRQEAARQHSVLERRHARLRKHASLFTRRLRRTEDILNTLYEEDQISSREKSEIQAERTLDAQARKLVDLLISKRNDTVFSKFESALLQTNQRDLHSDLKGDPMDERKMTRAERVIQRNYNSLVNNIDALNTQLIDKLYELEVLNDREKDDVMAEKAVSKRMNEKLLSIMSRCSYEEFERFLSVLDRYCCVDLDHLNVE